MEDSRCNAIRQLITFVKFLLNFSSKITTAANVQLTESLLDNCLKNDNIAVNIIYYLRSLFVSYFYEFISQPQKKTKQKNRILWQRAKIKPEWISQSNGNIGRPLEFVIDSLNTSASLLVCRIAPCLTIRDYFNFQKIYFALFYSLKENYGRVFSLKMGSFKFVMASSPEAVKEMLVQRSADYAGRPQTHFFVEFTLGRLTVYHFKARLLYNFCGYQPVHLFFIHCVDILFFV